MGDIADTAEFAVESIRRWWNQMGAARFPDATTLLITADAGGSNGSRVRAWKAELATFAAEAGLDITVMHYPPGTSKWNKIEHRLFSFISMNWRGRPLTDMRTIVELIAATKTKTGLTVQGGYDPNWYPTGVKISDRDSPPSHYAAQLARRMELHHRSGMMSRTIPRRALIGFAFVGLAVYLAVQSTVVLALGFHPRHSPLGILWTGVTAV